MIGLLSPILAANRPVPKWQGLREGTTGAAVRCLSSGLARFGAVQVERGAKPEAGSVRVRLRGGAGYQLRTRATIFVEKGPGFGAVWMDAETDRLGDAIWKEMRRRCRVR